MKPEIRCLAGWLRVIGTGAMVSVALALTLAGCGQRGPLYLPDPAPMPAPGSQPAPAADPPSPAAPERPSPVRH